MNHQQNKLENARTGVRKCRKILHFFTVFTCALAVLLLVFLIAIAANQSQVNRELLAATATGEMSLMATVDFELMGIIHLGADLQNLIQHGEFATALMMAFSVATVALVIISCILHQITAVFTVIEKSESPFGRQVLKSFKRVFILTTVLLIPSTELYMIILIVVLLTCIYRLMEYAACLQAEVDELL